MGTRYWLKFAIKHCFPLYRYCVTLAERRLHQLFCPALPTSCWKTELASTHNSQTRKALFESLPNLQRRNWDPRMLCPPLVSKQHRVTEYPRNVHDITLINANLLDVQNFGLTHWQCLLKLNWFPRHNLKGVSARIRRPHKVFDSSPIYVPSNTSALSSESVSDSPCSKHWTTNGWPKTPLKQPCPDIRSEIDVLKYGKLVTERTMGPRRRRVPAALG